MVDVTDIYIVGSVPMAQQAIQQAFQMNNFTVQWRDGLNGKAMQGSRGKNLAFGAFSQYYEQDFQIFVSPDQTIVIRLVKATSGWAGGAIGAMKVNDKFREIVNLLTMYFSSMGVYRGRNPP